MTDVVAAVAPDDTDLSPRRHGGTCLPVRKRHGRASGMSAVRYDGEGAFSIAESSVAGTETGRGAARCCILRHLRHRPAYRPRRDGRAHSPAAGDRPRDGRHGRRGRRRRRADCVSAIPSSCARSMHAASRLADRGFSHISRNLRFLGIDAPGALQSSWTVPAFTVHKVPAGLDLRLAALAEPLAVACHDVRRRERDAGQTVVVIGGGPIGILIALVAAARGARVLVVEPDARSPRLAPEFGFEAFDPLATISRQPSRTRLTLGAEVVFEVSGSAAGILAATKHAAFAGESSWSRSSRSQDRSRSSTSSGRSSRCEARASTSRRTSRPRSRCWRADRRLRAADHAPSSRSSGCPRSSTSCAPGGKR